MSSQKLPARLERFLLGWQRGGGNWWADSPDAGSDDEIVELKAVERLQPAHEAQLLTYLRVSGCRIGLLLNFNAVRLKEGLRRLVRSRQIEPA